MTTAVDTSVLLDVLLDDPVFGPASLQALQQASNDGRLIISETTLAEIIPVLKSGTIDQFLSEGGLQFEACGKAAAILAGTMFRKFLDRGGKRGRVVPDFLLGMNRSCVQE